MFFNYTSITPLVRIYLFSMSQWARGRLKSPASLLFTQPFFSGADQRSMKARIHRWPVNSPHKGPVTRKMFPSDDGITLFVESPAASSNARYGTIPSSIFRAYREAFAACLQNKCWYVTYNFDGFCICFYLYHHSYQICVFLLAPFPSVGFVRVTHAVIWLHQ